MKFICNKCKAEYTPKKTQRGVMSSSSDSVSYNCPKCGSDNISRIRESNK